MISADPFPLKSSLFSCLFLVFLWPPPASLSPIFKFVRFPVVLPSLLHLPCHSLRLMFPLPLSFVSIFYHRAFVNFPSQSDQDFYRFCYAPVCLFCHLPYTFQLDLFQAHRSHSSHLDFPPRFVVPCSQTEALVTGCLFCYFSWRSISSLICFSVSAAM